MSHGTDVWRGPWNRGLQFSWSLVLTDAGCAIEHVAPSVLCTSESRG